MLVERRYDTHHKGLICYAQHNKAVLVLSVAFYFSAVLGAVAPVESHTR